MSAPEVNIPLLRKAVEWAEAEAAKPFELSQWNQLDWVSTPAAQARARARVAESEINEELEELTVALAKKAPECGTCFCIAGYVTHELEGVVVGSNHDSWSWIAERALGLDGHSAGRLFCATNTIEDVRRIAESIAGERL